MRHFRKAVRTSFAAARYRANAGCRARKTRSSSRTKPGRHDFRKTFAGDPLDAIGDLSTVQNVLFSVAQPAFYDKVVADIGGHVTETAILYVKVAYVKR
jgi:hypothetical protein